MIDTDKHEGHTPAPWTVTKHSEEFADIDAGPTRITTVTLDDDGWDDSWTQFKLKDEMLANAQLIADAPLLLAEVKRLRGQLEQAREFLWWCYDKERFGWEIDKESWNLIGRLLGADTDHNDNEWSEEE
jgi:hypothetical protein